MEVKMKKMLFIGLNLGLLNFTITSNIETNSSQKKSNMKIYLAGGAAVTAACVGGLCYFYPEQAQATLEATKEFTQEKVVPALQKAGKWTKETAAPVAQSWFNKLINNGKYYFYKYISDEPWKAGIYNDLKF